MPSSRLLEKLDEEFGKTCKVIFGGGIGALADFEPYLKEYMQQPKKFKSAVSDEDVYLSGSSYLPSSRFLGFNEIDWKRKFEPLGINEIKDIDSIVGAL